MKQQGQPTPVLPIDAAFASLKLMVFKRKGEYGAARLSLLCGTLNAVRLSVSGIFVFIKSKFIRNV